MNGRGPLELVSGQMPSVSRGLRALTEPPGWGISVSRSGEFSGQRHHHPAAERVRLDPLDHKAAQVEQTRGVRYRILLNMANVRTLGQVRGLTSIRNCL